MKHCKRCDKDTEDWGKAPYCRPCWRAYAAAQRERDGGAGNRKAALAWYYRNREKALAIATDWKRRNPEKNRAHNKKWYDAHGREYADKNREKLNARSRIENARRRREQPEKVRADKKASYGRHRIRIRAKVSAKYRANLDENRAKGRERYERERDRYIGTQIRIRSQRVAAPGSHTTEEWHALLERHNYTCAYCPAKLTRRTATRDHIVALKNGGSNYISNIAPACSQCNNWKRCMSAEEFQAKLLAIKELLNSRLVPRDS